MNTQPMPCLLRRTLLARFPAVLFSAGLPAVTQARPASPATGGAPLVGVDPILVEGGLTARWSAAMARDLGWAARWTPIASGSLLAQLEQGQLDAGLYLGHPHAARLEAQGLVHSRTVLARTLVYLTGPEADPAGIRQQTDLRLALAQVLLAQDAGAARWEAPAPDSALWALVAQLTQDRPTARLDRGTALSRATTEKAVALAAYGLTTRAQWQARGNTPGVRVWVTGGPELALPAELALPFRRRHPGAQLLLKWMRGPLAEGVWRSARPGWLPASA